MDDAIPEMTDIVFPVSGKTLPANYAFALWHEAVRVLPWLDGERSAGILPLCPPEGGGLMLSRRARMVLRVPSRCSTEAYRLSGRTLDVGGHAIATGEPRERPLHPHSTLHAQLVASAASEDAFVEEVAAALREMGAECKWICGKRLVLPGSAGTVAGYSLVVHDLKPQESLRLQWSGLGSDRHFGCGIFIPYKVIGNLE
jgi:CRISPR-associated protein Cas6